KRYTEAEQLYREALAGYQRKFGPDHRSVAKAQTEIGGVLIDAGQFASAEVALLEADRIGQAAKGITAAERTDSLKFLADLYETWDKAEPGKGHDAQAAAWKAKVEQFPGSASATDGHEP